MSPPQQVGARIPKQAASISPASLKRQEEVLPMAKLEQRRYKSQHALRCWLNFIYLYLSGLRFGGIIAVCMKIFFINDFAVLTPEAVKGRFQGGTFGNQGNGLSF